MKETVIYPFCKEKAWEYSVDANLGSNSDGKTFHKVQLRRFGDRVRHAGPALTDRLLYCISIFEVQAKKLNLADSRESGVRTAILPVVINCPPSGFLSKVALASDSRNFGTLTFADQHRSHSSSLMESRSFHSEKRVQPCLCVSPAPFFQFSKVVNKVVVLQEVNDRRKGETYSIRNNNINTTQLLNRFLHQSPRFGRRSHILNSPGC